MIKKQPTPKIFYDPIKNLVEIDQDCSKKENNVEHLSNKFQQIQASIYR